MDLPVVALPRAAPAVNRRHRKPDGMALTLTGGGKKASKPLSPKPLNPKP